MQNGLVKKIFDFIEKSFQKIGRKKIFFFALFFLVISFGAWLRLYHFADWIHYEADESRDNILVAEAIKHGPSSLPLLGPRASGTQLRLGPAYYYLEYFSALIFSDTPQGHAFFVPLLSIASILIFYLLLHRFFNIAISLSLTYLYSISFFVVIHSRYGWNPNVLPFFVIAGIYCLLRATDGQSKYPGRWFVACAFLFGVATQVHFVAFFALPALTICYLLYKRTKFSYKAWGASILIIIALYIPVVINDIALDGYNFREFVRAFSVKSDQKETILEKSIIVMRSGSEYYALILSGNDRIWTPRIKFEKGWVGLSCKNHCKKTSPWVNYSAMSFFLFGALLFIWRMFARKKQFIIIGLFFLIVFLMFVQISGAIESHFYFLVILMPFFFLGNIIELIWQRNALVAKIILVGFVIIFSYTNISRVLQRFSELGNADKKMISVEADRVINEPERISLKQFQAISRYMAGKYEENGYPVLISAENIYFRSFMYLTEKMGAPSGPLDKNSVYLHANPFVILRTKRSKNINAYLNNYDLINKKEFGTLSLFELSPKAPKSSAVEVPPLVDSFRYIAVPFQITWGDALSKIRTGNLGI